MLNFFVGGCSQQQLLDVLVRVAADCPKCHGKRMHFCIEEKCQGSQPFCLLCQSHLHFLHKKNELRMLFIDRQLVNPSSREIFDRADRLSALIGGQKLRSQELIEKQVRLVRIYDRLLQDLAKLRTDVTNHDHLSQLYSNMKEAVLGQPIDYQQCRQELMKTFKSMRFDGRANEIKKMHSMQQMMKFLSEYQDNPLQVVEYPNKSLHECCQNILYQKLNVPTIQAMIRDTYLQRYITDNDHPVYWGAADSAYRARRCKVGQQLLCRGNRLIVDPDPSAVGMNCDISVKNTLKQLTITSQLINVCKFPEGLLKLFITLQANNIGVVTQKLPQSLIHLKIIVGSTYWSPRTPYALKNLKKLKNLLVRDTGIRVNEVRDIIQQAISNQFRSLCLLKEQVKMATPQLKTKDSMTSSTRLQSFPSHIYPKLQPHYNIYKRKIIQLQCIYQRKIPWSHRINEQIVSYAQSKFEAAQDRNEDLAFSRRQSMATNSQERIQDDI